METRLNHAARSYQRAIEQFNELTEELKQLEAEKEKENE
jgi:hypothetical protein